jgi:hypothetical protein
LPWRPFPWARGAQGVRAFGRPRIEAKEAAKKGLYAKLGALRSILNDNGAIKNGILSCDQNIATQYYGGRHCRPQVFENAGFDPNGALWARVCKNFGVLCVQLVERDLVLGNCKTFCLSNCRKEKTGPWSLALNHTHELEALENAEVWH